jgi:predicted O-linked N-acetylglucosamine transferase (SPINDLY family)
MLNVMTAVDRIPANMRVMNALATQSVARALELFRRGFLREAAALCEQLLSEGAPAVQTLALLADIRLSMGLSDDAVAALTALARLAPKDAANMRRLGAALLAAGQPMDAIAAFRQAIDIEPDNARAHNNLGNALLATSDATGAILHFQRAVELQPGYAVGYGNLGTALTQTGDFEGAAAALQRAVDIDPSLVVARLNLGVALERCGKLSQALGVYDHLVRAWPDCADAWVARGSLLLSLNRSESALGSFATALELRRDDARAFAGKASALLLLNQPVEALQEAESALRLRSDFAEALVMKSSALCRLNRHAEALGALERALVLEPANVQSWCDLAVVHQYLGEDSRAIDCLRRALDLDDGCVQARSALIAGQIPSIALSHPESIAARDAFVAELDAFEAWTRCRDLTEAQAWTMARQTFFYLSYQEESNGPLLTRYRSASAAHLARVVRLGEDDVHDELRSGAAGISNDRFKLGFVSAQVYDHSVFNALLQGWLHGLDRRRFETTLFSLGAKRDAATLAAAAAVDHFEHTNRTAAEWADCIARKRLDGLIFPEVGIDRNTLALASLRLARRQYVAWGHPETSGLPTIDVFLSAEAFEPVDAQAHYSERLVQLPHLGVYYEPFAEDPAAIDLDRFGIPGDVPLLICPGAPFKYRPADDSVWVGIARRLGRCTLAFFQHERSELSRKLQQRLAAAFAREGLDAARFVVFLPWLPRYVFLGLMRRADAYLDTIGFSGFNTFMQAVQANLPGVALEGRFMRGRLGSGILRHLGLGELVAYTQSEYIAIAVKLAEDPAYRERLRCALRDRQSQAYRDVGVVEALSEHLVNP